MLSVDSFIVYNPFKPDTIDELVNAALEIQNCGSNATARCLNRIVMDTVEKCRENHKKEKIKETKEEIMREENPFDFPKLTKIEPKK